MRVVEHIALDTKGHMVYGENPRVVVTIGAEDLIIVDTGDILLVCKPGPGSGCSPGGENIEGRRSNRPDLVLIWILEDGFGSLLCEV